MQIIKNIKDFFRNFSEERKQREIAKLKQRINERFAIEEVHGKIAITIYQTPIRVFDKEVTTKQIEEELKSFRETANKYYQ